MELLAVTKHAALVERLRGAFEGAGHSVQRMEDPLEALASEAWNNAQLILLDATGDPMDGFRLCGLLRGESRILFQNLPIYLVFEQTPTEEECEALRAADADGWILAHEGVPGLVGLLGPALEGAPLRTDRPRVPLLAVGVPAASLRRIRGLVEHFGYQLQACGHRDLAAAQQELRAPLALLWVDRLGNRAQESLALLREGSSAPAYTILLGAIPRGALQRRLLLAGAMDWIPAPVSLPRLLHACRRGLEWQHVKRIQQEYQHHINDLRERRMMLEIEAAALRNEVLTDPLTELLNRRAFTQNLENALNQWARHHRPFVLILGDLDYFKLVNDRFGHMVGDRVLRDVARLMRMSLRRSDLAFRIGGEEFAILLAETSLRSGTEVAEKLRRRIDESPIQLETGQTIFPTMSFGVGSPDGIGAEDFFQAVDRALYLAKRKGRNRIEQAVPAT